MQNYDILVDRPYVYWTTCLALPPKLGHRFQIVKY